MEVIRKLATCFISLLVFLSVCKVCPVERNVDDDFIATTPFYAQVVYLYLSMLTTRPKYYFVWTLGAFNVSHSVFHSFYTQHFCSFCLYSSAFHHLLLSCESNMLHKQIGYLSYLLYLSDRVNNYRLGKSLRCE